MNALNRLGAAIAVGSLSLAMLGCNSGGSSSKSSSTDEVADVQALTAEKTSTPLSSLSFTDDSLALCIKSTGHQYIEDIVTLRCNNKGIRYLEGIEQLTKLKILHLSFNSIEDITQLVELKELETLYLSGNEIQNLDSLSSLTNLTELGIEKNYIQDLSPLQSLSSLKSLHTNKNQISDFTILNSLELNVLSGTNSQDS